VGCGKLRGEVAQCRRDGVQPRGEIC
jgi:hypothetical protein